MLPLLPALSRVEGSESKGAQRSPRNDGVRSVSLRGAGRAAAPKDAVLGVLGVSAVRTFSEQFTRLEVDVDNS
jgi:hypothetical protein